VVSGARNSALISSVFRHVIGIAGTAHAGCAKIDTTSSKFPARRRISCAVRERVGGFWRVWTHQDGGIEKMGLLNFLGENE
jgi:hypothetical protein